MPSRHPHLIFDLDDTLIESFPLYAETHEKVARELGLRVPSREELANYGATWRETLAGFWPDTPLDGFLARYEAAADDLVYPLIHGVLDALETLQERGHTLWIVTKRSRNRLHGRMADAGLPAELFAGIFPVEDQPLAKPSPRCFEPVWEQLGAPDPKSAIYVGDRHEDMMAAQAAGMTFLAVRSGPEPSTPFDAQLPASAVLDTAADVPKWLDRRG